MRTPFACAIAALVCLSLDVAAVDARAGEAEQGASAPLQRPVEVLRERQPGAPLYSPILVQGRRPITCNTSCYDRCQRGVLPGVTVPDGQCYSACITDKARACGEAATRQDEPIHGNYCGLGNRGGRPIDRLDAACKVHDDCYDRRAANKCSCDRAMSQRAAELAAFSWNLSMATREKAALIAIFFAAVPCED